MGTIQPILRYPAVSQEHVAFVHGGDVWVIRKEDALAGGVATKLTSASGRESRPRFSPDGKLIAFSGNYGGSVDVYVIPTEGGVPRRLTHHPAQDHVVDWIPDGEESPHILYASAMESPFPLVHRQLFRLSSGGGVPRKVPLTSAAFGSLCKGEVLAFQEQDSISIPRRRVRAGGAPQIYLFDLKKGKTLVKLTDSGGEATNDSNFHPMWTLDGTKLFFLSNRQGEHHHSLWYFEDLDLRDLRKNTSLQPKHFYSCKSASIRFPAMGLKEIAFEKDGSLYLLDLKDASSKPLDIQIPGDRRQRMVQVKDVGPMIRNWDISPSGKRVVFEARGHLFTVPIAEGPVRHLTSGSGVAHRTPAWSPDGKRIAYFSDRQGEYQLALQRSDGSGRERFLTDKNDFPDGFRYRPFWSPDSKKLAFIDHLRRIYVYILGSGADPCQGTIQKADDEISWIIHASPRRFRISWSPCSRYITYARKEENFHDAIFLWDSEEEKRVRLTSGYYPDRDPVFGAGGDYIFFQTLRSRLPMSDYEAGSWAFFDQFRIAALPLRKDVRSLFAPRRAEEIDSTAADTNGETSQDICPCQNQGSAEADTTCIDLDEDLEQWLQLLPKPEPGLYGSLHALPGRLLMVQPPTVGGGSEHPGIIEIDLISGEQRFIEEALPGLSEFTVAANGKEVLCCCRENPRKPTFFCVDTTATAAASPQPIRTDILQVTVDPPKEWLQIFDDAWRILRDYFYDPKLNDLDWEERRGHYQPMVAAAATRWDVNQILREMASDLEASHTGVYKSGDVERSKTRAVGLLGADFEPTEGGFLIRRILRGASWDSEYPSPLHEARVAENSSLLAVDGIKSSQVKNPWEALESRGDRIVELSVREGLEGAKAVTKLVRTISFGEEIRLRYLRWIERNRSFVRARDPRIAYIHIPSVLPGGLAEFYRQLRAQANLPGFIFDARLNTGGFTPESFLQFMGQQRLGIITYRGSQPRPLPIVSGAKHRVMLINESTLSWGEVLAHSFEEQGLGDLVGTTTRGAALGASSTPHLVDGGIVIAGTLPVRNALGEIIAEGVGVSPRRGAVPQEPKFLLGEEFDPSRDEQLLKAIELIRKKL